MTNTNNTFAILSVSNNPTTTNKAPALVTSNTNESFLATDDITIMHDPQEHRRQRKVARRQHVRLMLRRMPECNNLFLKNSITIAEDKRTDMAKNNNNNAKRNAINLAHSKRVPTHIGWVQRGRNLAYKLSSAFNKTIQKLNKSTQHVRFTSHDSK